MYSNGLVLAVWKDVEAVLSGWVLASSKMDVVTTESLGLAASEIVR